MQKGTLTVDEWLREVLDGKLPPAAAHGKVYSVDISNTASGFRARTAAVYMPPAALSDTPPELPVLVMLAGQPGNPDRVFSASGIAAILDQYAKAHHGLAPIVISPDQNGDNTVNSLCADTTKVGRAETYLTVDVPRCPGRRGIGRSAGSRRVARVPPSWDRGTRTYSAPSSPWTAS